jgi:hypothetical protein
MTAVNIRLTSQQATVECDACGQMESVPVLDRYRLLALVRQFVEAHRWCLGIMDARMP